MMTLKRMKLDENDVDFKFEDADCEITHKSTDKDQVPAVNTLGEILMPNQGLTMKWTKKFLKFGYFAPLKLIIRIKLFEVKHFCEIV